MLSNLKNVDEILSKLRHKTSDHLYGYTCITRLDQSNSVFIFSTKETAVVIYVVVSKIHYVLHKYFADAFRKSYFINITAVKLSFGMSYREEYSSRKN
jgi:hypothetical protein